MLTVLNVERIPQMSACRAGLDVYTVRNDILALRRTIASLYSGVHPPIGTISNYGVPHYWGLVRCGDLLHRF